MSQPQAKEDTNNKLNLFRFAQKRKNSNSQKAPVQKTDRSLSSGTADPLSANSASAAGATATDTDTAADKLRIDTTEDDDAFPPESLVSSQDELQMLSPMDAQTESSLIFERSVEDPIQVYQQTQCPRCGKNSSGGLKCNHNSIAHLPSHYSVENFVSPCLDATTKILTDENTDLNNVDMVYSRRPSSVMGLNMALGRTRSSVVDGTPSTSPPHISKTQSLASMKELDASSPTSPKPPMLSFYSYADMISSENSNPRRPSISQSLSSTFLNRSNSVSMAANGLTPQRTPLNARPSFSSPFAGRPSMGPRTSSMSRTATNTSGLGAGMPSQKFSLNTDTSPNSSDSESDYVHTRKNSVNSRSSRKSAAFNQRLLNRSTSNQSSLLGSPMTPGRRYSNLDDACFDASDNDSLVVNSVGETLRRNNGEIQSRNSSIIA